VQRNWQKAACKMLLKLTTGVDFTNILRAAITCADHKSTKIHLSPLPFWDLHGKKLRVKYL